MASNKKYWKSVEELNPESSIVETLKQNEFIQEIPVDDFLGDKETLESSSTSRRDFLKYVGFSTAAASLAACEGPVKKSIPYVVQPEEIRPGVANYYATTIADGYDFASVLVKTREGRPIKIENNKEAGVKADANARVQASVLSLYDSLRLKGSKASGKSISNADLDTAVAAKLNAIKDKQGSIVLLTQTFASPSTTKIIQEFKEKYGNVSHVVYDAVSEDAALTAYQQKYGVRAFADYDFAKADLIVSIGADFLGDWQGGGYDTAYAKKRVPQGSKGHAKMSRHFQFEANMSLTGANADKRVLVTPAEQKVALAKLYGYLTGQTVSGALSDKANKHVALVAKELKAAGSKAVVVSGVQDVDAQLLVLEINNLLQSAAFDTSAPKLLRQGDAAKVSKLVLDMNAGRVDAVIMAGVNPVYTMPDADAFVSGLKKVSLSVAFSLKEDETASIADYVVATPHYLESWGDVQMKKGSYALTQPTIRPLFDTRQFQEVLLQWAGNTVKYYDYIKQVWANDILKGASWNQALHDGFYVSGVSNDQDAQTDQDSVVLDLAAMVSRLSKSVSKGMALTLYAKTGMGDGQQANNPWLQEFPDPISRVSWDNYLTVSKTDAKELGLKNWHVANGGLNGSYANVTANDVTIKVPVLIQPGQAKGTVGLSFGYGRKSALKQEMQTGVNAYQLYKDFSAVQDVTIEAASGEHEFACVQLHNTLMGRGDIIKEASLEVFNTKDAASWNPMPVVSLNHQETPVTSPDVDLWDEFDRSIGHHFNLSIDLNSCTGCGACVIACHAENNVPVVGKEEVRKSRDMHWLRIDRYYSAEETFEADNAVVDNISGLSESLSTFGEMEDPSASPQVAFQPVMCQHCNHAPCETVCPVAATSHGRQGQNHMAYNRCVGTRYCANNCPYKVRRFNWFLYNNNDEFDYHMNDDLGKMVLNPDVVVRSRGVMEKCSMCIQMTQKTILDAKREGRVLKDGELQTACSAACSSGSMTFGDINDKTSAVSHLKADDRMYHLLEHVGTKPNVFYHVKVRNTDNI